MAEETANLPEQQQNNTAAPKVAGVGRRQSFTFNSAPDDVNDVVVQVAPQDTLQTETQADGNVVAEAQQVQEPQAPTPDQLRAYFKSIGVDFDGDTEALKEKFKPKQAEPSEEEKIAAKEAREKMMLDVFVENGGTVDQFLMFKQVQNTDIQQLSKGAAIKELMEAGLDKEEAEAEYAHRYYLNELESATQDFDNDETDEEFAKRKEKLQKKVDTGAKLLALKSLPIKQQADQFFNNLDNAIKAKELQKQQEEQFSSKVDEHFSKLPRKMTFELGKHDSKDIAPIQYEVSDADINEVKEMLKDPAKRKQFLFNPDNTLNIENIAQAMLGNKALTSAAKTAFLEGRHRNTQEFLKVFPARSAYDLGGVGGAPTKADQKGQIAKKGTPQRVGYQQFHKQ